MFFTSSFLEHIPENFYRSGKKTILKQEHLIRELINHCVSVLNINLNLNTTLFSPRNFAAMFLKTCLEMFFFHNTTKTKGSGSLGKFLKALYSMYSNGFPFRQVEDFNEAIIP